VLAGPQVAADAADPEPQDQHAGRDAAAGGADEQGGGACRAGGGPGVIGPPVAQFLDEQAVQVRAERLVGGGQPGGGRGPLDVQRRRAEQVADRGPLPGEQVDFGALDRRVGGVQLVQQEQLRVHRGQQAGVERFEQPVPFGGLGGLQDLLAGRVRGVDVPGQLAGYGRGLQLVARDRVALARGRAGARDADGGHAGHHERERGAARHKRSGRGSSKRPHTYAPNPAAWPLKNLV
jgi:hypothetical protein